MDAPDTVLAAARFWTSMLPVESRFTMELGVFVLVGATFQLRARVPVFVTGDPDTLKSAVGALSPTLDTLPVPGKVCPVAKVSRPFGAILRPVSPIALVPEP